MASAADRIITVNHYTDDDMHIVEIHAPIDWWLGDHLTARLPIHEFDAVDALWSGYDEALRWAKREGIEYIRFVSTDSGAYAQFIDELGGVVNE